ncbi:HWE histidine kinase domain-containing protein [Bradyrhizobium sp. CCBAU 051011]|uniref:HWE histidine kinase domain-containing protein n=1 Tax=Bradyrhizobium sp. CCBAU 051011 TaxID=858422 RepID=UPI001FEE280F|nr:HWE histidine kinase domain-containing protein [Bradyrhizobium sp. CCBAU 051011]
MLIDELNHRVKNTLSTAQSIVWQTLRTTTDPKQIRQSIESRLSGSPVARSADPREMGKCRPARYRSRCAGTIRGGRRTGGSHRDHGGEHPLSTKSSFGPWYRVQRTCDQCREIRCVVQRGRIDPDLVDGGDDTRREKALAELERERWFPRPAAGTQGIWLAGARAWPRP